jgi:hypothetical protein
MQLRHFSRSHDECKNQAHVESFWFGLVLIGLVCMYATALSRLVSLLAATTTTVLIEGGRATADKVKGIITTNFHRAPSRTLNCAIWFVRKEPNANKDKKTNLDPIFNKEDTQKIEALYQKAIEAMSSLGTYEMIQYNTIRDDKTDKPS